MIDARKHQNNLYSIFPFIPETWRDKIFFKYLIDELKSKTSWLILIGRRPLVDISSSILETFKQKDIIYIDTKPFFFEFLLFLSETSVDQKAFELICLAWRSYDQLTIILSKEIDPFLNVDSKRIINLSWKEITLLSTSYIFFKGAEEDVLWIGKSDLLEFPAFDTEEYL